MNNPEASLSIGTLRYLSSLVRSGEIPTLKELSLEIKSILYDEFVALSGENRRALERLSTDLSNLIEDFPRPFPCNGHLVYMSDVFIDGIVKMFSTNQL